MNALDLRSRMRENADRFWGVPAHTALASSLIAATVILQFGPLAETIGRLFESSIVGFGLQAVGMVTILVCNDRWKRAWKESRTIDASTWAMTLVSFCLLNVGIRIILSGS